MRALRDRLHRRREAGAGRVDPAPSRLRYRLQRWMLTPGIRFGLRFGLPFCLIFAAGSAYLADESRRDELLVMLQQAREAVEQRPEFMVNVMAVDGAGPRVAQDIREVMPAEFPVSSFDLDLEQIRDVITDLDPVETARVRIRPGGILQVDVKEREPALIWRSRAGLALLDAQGVHVAELGRRSLRPNLPLIAGKGAETKAHEALQLFAAAQPLGDRLRGLVRVGERRWDVVLDREQRIQLPVEQPVQALERVLAVNEVQDLLERDVATVDMRLATRPTVRMTQDAMQSWWQIRQLNEGGQ